MAYTALIPVKSLEQAKSRLAPYLTQQQRATLVLSMLHHVIHTLRESQQFAHISVVSADQNILNYAQQWGARALIEEQPGHNQALTQAAKREFEEGSTALLTISLDLPLLQVDDINDLCELSQTHDIVLASSQGGTGTNAMLTRPPLIMPYAFGSGSLQRHLKLARRAHLSSITHASVGLALDIDTIDDLATAQYYSDQVLYPALCS